MRHPIITQRLSSSYVGRAYPIVRACLSAVAATSFALASAADGSSSSANAARVPFALVAPLTLSGEWRTDPQPGEHPTDSRNSAQVRILTLDKETGAYTGTMDIYVKNNRCGMGAKISGSFDGTTLRGEATVCDGRHPTLEVWKERDGFRGHYGRRALYLDADR